MQNGVDVVGPGCRYHGEVMVAIAERTGQESEVSELKHRFMEDTSMMGRQKPEEKT